VREEILLCLKEVHHVEGKKEVLIK